MKLKPEYGSIIFLTSLFYSASVSASTITASRAPVPAPFRNVAGQSTRQAADSLKFSYRTFDTGESLTCKHALLSAESHDWSVKCSDTVGGSLKLFTVHLWVTRYDRNEVPRTGFELLYWVTDQTSPQNPVGSSVSQWIFFKDATELSSIQMGLGVDSETAGLYVEYTP